ncbi:MAG: DDE-type integrase/transposase/recombinase [Kangiella sp.]|nr:DDE-type integrase/transposase/recombinase [Kangiella sp.]
MIEITKVKPGQRFKFEGNEFEIIHIDEYEVRYAKTKGGNIQVLASERFRSLAKANKIELHGYERYDSDEQLYLTPQQIEERNRKLEYVQTTLNRTCKPTSRREAEPIIQEVATRRNEEVPGSSTVFKWVRRYISSGYRANALVSGCYQKGNRNKRVCYHTEIVIDQLINEQYLTIQRPTIAAIYEKLQILHLHGEINELPSIRTLERRINRISQHAKLKNRHGSQAATRILRAAGCSVNYSRALEAVQADGHILNVLVVDDQTGEILGRAYATIIIDVYTRCIISAVITLQPFCTSTVIEATKLALTAGYNGLGGHMSNFFVDNGADYVSKSLKNLASTIGMNIDYGPPNEPNFKAHIETFFDTLNTGLVHRLKGTTWSSPADRGDYPSEELACLPLEKIQELIHEWIFNEYHKRVHDGHKRIPLSIWDESRKQHPIYIHKETDINTVARVVERRTVNKGRVIYDGLAWYSHALASLEAELRAAGKSRKLDVYIDTNNLVSVLVRDPRHKNNFIQADSTTPEFTQHLTIEEYKIAQKELKMKTASDLERFPIQDLIEFRNTFWMKVDEISDPKVRKQYKRKQQSLRKQLRKEEELTAAPRAEVLLKKAAPKIEVLMDFDELTPEEF